MKADNKKIKNRLNRIRGQIDGISKMVDEDKYCLDISAQLLAVSSAINSVNQEILSAHLRSCVADSFIILLFVSDSVCTVLQLIAPVSIQTK